MTTTKTIRDVRCEPGYLIADALRVVNRLHGKRWDYWEGALAPDPFTGDDLEEMLRCLLLASGKLAAMPGGTEALARATVKASAELEAERAALDEQLKTLRARGPVPCYPFPEDAEYKTIGGLHCPRCGMTDVCWRRYLSWEKSMGITLNEVEHPDVVDEDQAVHLRPEAVIRAPDAQTPERDCTCTGSCKGAAGLAPGWRCALRALNEVEHPDVDDEDHRR